MQGRWPGTSPQVCLVHGDIGLLEFGPWRNGNLHVVKGLFHSCLISGRRNFTVLQDALNSLVSPVAVRQLDLTEGVIERVDDLVDCLTCVGRRGLQPRDPSVKVPRERPEHIYVEVVLGGSRDKETMSKVQHRVGNGRSHMRSR